jgi:hypothetical protein
MGPISSANSAGSNGLALLGKLSALHAGNLRPRLLTRPRVALMIMVQARSVARAWMTVRSRCRSALRCWIPVKGI